MDALYAAVAVDIRVFDELSYRVPEALKDDIRVGQLVHIPFRNQRKTGVIRSLTTQAPDFDPDKIRDILEIVDLEPVAGSAFISFLNFMADYYLVPFSEVLRVAIPSSIRTDGAKFYTPLREITPPDDLVDTFTSMPDEGEFVASLRERSGLLFSKLAELEKAKCVSVSYVDTSKVKEKKERFYAATPQDENSPKGKLGKKQIEILAYLRRRTEPVSSRELKGVFENPYSSLKGLLSKALINSWEESRYRNPFQEPPGPPKEVNLSGEQATALEAILPAIGADRYAPFLLHGVTGSGKTEVYIRAMKKVLEEGKSGLILLPEISLTPQFVAVFRSVFKDNIAVLHSGLSPAHRFDQWRKIRAGEVSIVIGARSALFAPLKKVAMIIVDEEHDSSFKQEEGVRYNARDMALVLAMKEKAVIILGSATPSLESFQNAKLNKFTYLEMKKRAANQALPAVALVDLRESKRVAGADFLSEELNTRLDRCIKAGQQSILFLNRRGFSPCILCGVCGHQWRCEACDVSLTYHRSQESLRCHHCDFIIRLPECCPVCENTRIGPKGIGTEQLADLLSVNGKNYFVARLDADTGKGKKLNDILNTFRAGKTNILVGTQMVTKGHDFPNVTLVGVIAADSGLNFPDFRGAERTFQLLSQVAGRAGRGSLEGHVIVQTYDPSHFALQCAATHDYHGFAEQELERRQRFQLPPFSSLIAAKFEATRGESVMRAAHRWANIAKGFVRREKMKDVIVKGPATAPFERLRNKFRWQVLLQGSRSSVRKVAIITQATYEEQRGVKVVIDVDPINML